MLFKIFSAVCVVAGICGDTSCMITSHLDNEIANHNENANFVCNINAKREELKNVGYNNGANLYQAYKEMLCSVKKTDLIRGNFRPDLLSKIYINDALYTSSLGDTVGDTASALQAKFATLGLYNNNADMSGAIAFLEATRMHANIGMFVANINDAVYGQGTMFDIVNRNMNTLEKEATLEETVYANALRPCFNAYLNVTRQMLLLYVWAKHRPITVDNIKSAFTIGARSYDNYVSQWLMQHMNEIITPEFVDKLNDKMVETE
ncbi:MAG: hypothetical protein LBB29_01305 [Holosporaceae bacterium]|jgi:hypothetical protein|nr:hypothetical protein [Holosporaceae bacterium]